MAEPSEANVPWEAHPAGVVLHVKAQPGARDNGLGPCQHGAVKVRVTAVAEKGKANAAIRDLLAQKLRLRKSQIELLAGEAHTQKRFLLHDLAIAELQAKLASLGIDVSSAR